MTDSARTIDVFLSYNRADDAFVRIVHDALALRGLKTFVDWQDLTAGLPWQGRIERALSDSRVVAVFVGPSGPGPWQTREISFALDLQAQNERAGICDVPLVIALLLAGADPPTSFLRVNTWVDLRGGISPESLMPLLHAIDGVVLDRLVPDVCPYRDLRAFREEDAELFFGRGQAIEQLLQRIDATSRGVSEFALVAIVGPSGSGKSSVAMAGVLPALRRQRRPQLIWDYVSFTPGDAPWRRFADALVPLLEDGLSEARRHGNAAALAEELRVENGIGSVIHRVLQKSRGTDRLLVIVDQFEELFTLTEEKTAREFVRALLAASRSVPMTVLLTLRSDYYGRAIVVNPDLSNVLPLAQVNLGLIGRKELRDVIEQPAYLAGLSFESGLVERILDDVDEGPGYLPLLEYALTELWKARKGDLLTFEAYERIGRVSGALVNRADELYDDLSDTQRVAARRLMLRLVRAASADEEGADTRRRARRSEIDDEAWKLVPFFSSSRARLLVAGTDVTSNEDVVEVVHEALIQKWDKLHGWVAEERRFLLWRQQLAVFRAKWIQGGREADEGTLLRGALLAEAQRWLRMRRADLSGDEGRYIEASGARVVRSRAMLRIAAAALGIALLAGGAWAIYQRSTQAVVNRLLARGPETEVVREQMKRMDKNLAALIQLGRLPQIRKAIGKLDGQLRARRYADLAIAMQKVQPQTDVKVLVDLAITEGRAQSKNTNDGSALLDVADVLLVGGRKAEAISALHQAEHFPQRDTLRLSYCWERAGNAERAHSAIVQAIRGVKEAELGRMDPRLVVEIAWRLAHFGERDRALALADRLQQRSQSMGDADRLRLLAYVAAIKRGANSQAPDLARTAENGSFDVDRWMASWFMERDVNRKNDQALPLFRLLITRRRFGDADAVANEPALIPEVLREMVGTFAAAGKLDSAARIAARLRTIPKADKQLVARAHGDLAVAYARAGKVGEAGGA